MSFLIAEKLEEEDMNEKEIQEVLEIANTPARRKELDCAMEFMKTCDPSHKKVESHEEISLIETIFTSCMFCLVIGLMLITGILFG